MPRPVRYQQQHQSEGNGGGSGSGGVNADVSGGIREGGSVSGGGGDVRGNIDDVPVFLTRSATMRKVPPPVGSLYQVVDNGNCSPRSFILPYINNNDTTHPMMLPMIL